jgi:ectoine hydroxylase
MTSTLHAPDPYVSRHEEQWRLVDRQDPVLWGDGEGPLDAALRQQFADNGFLFFDHLLSRDEAGALLDEANRLAQTADRKAPGVVVEPGGGAVRSLFRIHRTNEDFKAVARDPRLVEMARQILGSDVAIHQSRINFKPGFDGKEFFWHSDFETWHVEDGMPRMRAVSISINLTENTEFNGPLMLVPGSHRVYVQCPGGTPDEHYRQSLRKQEYGVPSREALAQLMERGGGITAPKGGPGSATMFDCNTMHGSVGNLSPYPRTNLFLVYNSVENGLEDPFGGARPRPEFLAERETVAVGEL